MAKAKSEKVEINLPKEIVFAMRPLKKPEDLQKKLKTALAILLFQEKSISLGKAVELAEMSRVRFMELLKEYNIPAYEYKEEDFQKDHHITAKYRELVGR